MLFPSYTRLVGLHCQYGLVQDFASTTGTDVITFSIIVYKNTVNFKVVCVSET